MKLSFSTLGCPRWDMKEIVATAKDLGYDGVELRGVQSELQLTRHKAFLPENIKPTRGLFASLSLAIPCITSGCVVSDPSTAKENCAEIKCYVDMAGELDAPYVRVMGDAYAGPSGNVDDYLVESQLSELGEYAKERGVTLLVETNGAYADTNRLAKLLQSVNSPAVKTLWDINHPYRYFGEPPEATVGNIGPMIRHVHMKDSIVSGGRIIYRLMGQGDLPILKSVALLFEAGFDGFYSLEWLKRFDLTLEDPGIAFVQYIAYMRNIKP